MATVIGMLNTNHHLRGYNRKKERRACVKPKSTTKLSYKDQKELSELPVKIEKMEAELEALQALVASEDFYKQKPDAVAVKMAELSELQKKIEFAYQRWDELGA